MKWPDVLARVAHQLFESSTSPQLREEAIEPELSMEMPFGRLEFRDNRTWVIIPGRLAGTEDLVSVEMTLEHWLELPPVQYVIKLELSQQQPRRPIAAAREEPVTLPIPRGHLEWKDGQNWIILTACRTGTNEPVVLEFTLWQWLQLVPVRYAVEERLERWQWNKARQLGESP